jgi:hypothetical protein
MIHSSLCIDRAVAHMGSPDAYPDQDRGGLSDEDHRGLPPGPPRSTPARVADKIGPKPFDVAVDQNLAEARAADMDRPLGALILPDSHKARGECRARLARGFVFDLGDRQVIVRASDGRFETKELCWLPTRTAESGAGQTEKARRRDSSPSSEPPHSSAVRPTQPFDITRR